MFQNKNKEDFGKANAGSEALISYDDLENCYMFRKRNKTE